MPDAVCIVERSGDGLELNRGNLDIVMQNIRDSAVNHISVISVTGSFRTGKSFLLNLMARYLRHHAGDPSSVLTTDIDWAEDSPEDPLRHIAFGWKPGVERHTVGIWVLPTIFVRRVKDKRVGIVLMDTQGLWDGETNYATLSSIFGLSSVMSSLQIYNLMRNVEIDKLDQLKWFAGFGAGALRASDQHAVSAFQSLHILVRDWVGFTDPKNIGSCSAQIEGFLPLQRRQAEFGKFLAEVESVYTQVGAMLLPPPGETCCFDNQFRGDLRSVDEAFLRILTMYFNKIFSKPVVKQVNGIPVTPDVFREMILRVGDLFLSDDLPGPVSFAGAMEDVVATCAREAAINRYRDGMQEIIASSVGLSPEDFAACHSKWSEHALALYDRGATYGSEAGVASHRDKLVTSLGEAYIDLTHRNTTTRMHGLDSYAICVVACGAGIVVDKSSDMVCDWWLSSCVDMSEMLARMYGYGLMLMALVICHFFWQNGVANGVSAVVSMLEKGGQYACRVLPCGSLRVIRGLFKYTVV